MKAPAAMLMLAGFAAPASPAPATETEKPLESYRWKARIVLVFGSGDAPVRQLEALAAAVGGLAERQTLVIEVDRRDDAAELRRFAGVAEGRFAVALVGKDGGLKHASDSPVSPETVFAWIDAMPMRQREMRESERARD